MINVGKGGLVSEHVGPLAEAGAHPLQALMALHVIFSTSHARGQQAMAAENTQEVQEVRKVPRGSRGSRAGLNRTPEPSNPSNLSNVEPLEPIPLRLHENC